jgi:Glycosyltransferase family 87
MLRWSGIVLGGVLSLFGLWSAWKIAAEAPGLDFYHFWIAGQEAPHAGNLYAHDVQARLGAAYLARATGSVKMVSVAERRTQLDLTATPFLYTCFAFFPRDYERATIAYAALLLVCCIAAIAILGRALRFSLAQTLLLLAFVLLLFQPLKSELRVLNVEELQLLLLAAAIALDDAHPLLAGAALGVAIAFKPNIGIVVPLLLVARRWRELGGVAIGGAAAVAISSAYLRSWHAWIDWLSAAKDVSQRLEPWSAGNAAAALPLIEAFGRPAMIALMLVLTAIAAFAVYRARSARLAIAFAPLIYILATSFVWMHYFMLALPLVMLLFASRAMPLQAAAALGLTLIGADIWDVLLQVRHQEGEVLILITGAVLLFAAGVATPFVGRAAPAKPRARAASTARA